MPKCVTWWNPKETHPERWKPFHSFARITSLTWTYVVFDKVGLSWGFQWDNTYDVLHMVVDMYQVLNPYSAGCWVSEAALLPSQEGDKQSHHWKPIVSLRAYNYSMASTPNSASKIRQVVKGHTLTWDIICIFMPCSKTFHWDFPNSVQYMTI